MVETIRYGLIGRQDLKVGRGIFEVELADGRIVILDEVDLMGRLLNVMDFGAVDDGTLTGGGTDNYRAFSNAITEARTTNAAVYIPRTMNYFRVESGFSIPSSGNPLVIFGAGPNTSRVIYTGTTGDLFQIGDGLASRHSVVLRDFGIFNVDDGAHDGVGWAIDLTQAPLTRIDRMMIDWTSTGSGGVRVDNSFGSTVTRSRIVGIKGTGFQTINSSGGAGISESYLSGKATTAGVLVSLSGRANFARDVTMETAAVGIDLLSVGPYYIRGYFENFGTNSIRGTPSSGAIRGLVIETSDFQDSGAAVSVDLSPTGGATIRDVRIHSNYWEASNATGSLRFNGSVTGVVGPNRFDHTDSTKTMVGTPSTGLRIVDPDDVTPTAAQINREPTPARSFASVADTATVVLAPDNTRFVIVEVQITGFNSYARFLLNRDNNSTTELSDPGAVFSVTQGTATSNNIYWNAGTSQYLLENNSGGVRSYRVAFYPLQ